MDYTPDPKTGLLNEEYVDIYGIPFSIIPFKGRKIGSKTPEDKPKNEVKALTERKHFEIRFPIVEGYTFIPVTDHPKLPQAEIKSYDFTATVD